MAPCGSGATALRCSASSPRPPCGPVGPFGAVAVHPAHRQAPAGELGPVAHRGDAAEEVRDESGDRLVRAVGHLESAALQLVDAAAAVRLPRGSAVLRGDGGQVGPLPRERVVFVAHLAHELLDDVLQGDHARRAAVLVDHHGDRLLAAQPFQQGLRGQGLRDQERRHGDAAHAGTRALTGRDGQGVLEVDHAGDLVDAVPVHGEAGQARGTGEVEDVGRRGVALEGADLDPRGHDVLRGQSAERQGADEEVRGVLFECAGAGGVPGEGDQLGGGAGVGRLLRRLDAEEPYEPVGHGVQQSDGRAEHRGEGVLRAGDETGDLEWPGHRPVLRHELADHHLQGRRGQHADGHGGAVHRSRGQSGRGEGGAEQPGERRFGEHADHQGGEGDAELGAGELERQLPQRLDDGDRAAVAVGGGAFGVRPLHRDEAELGGHEEAVGEDQQEGRAEQQECGGHAAASSCAGKAAQVLPDGPSIAGGSHSSGRWCPAGGPGGAGGVPAVPGRRRVRGAGRARRRRDKSSHGRAGRGRGRVRPGEPRPGRAGARPLPGVGAGGEHLGASMRPARRRVPAGAGTVSARRYGQCPSVRPVTAGAAGGRACGRCPSVPTAPAGAVSARRCRCRGPRPGRAGPGRRGWPGPCRCRAGCPRRAGWCRR